MKLFFPKKISLLSLIFLLIFALNLDVWAHSTYYTNTSIKSYTQKKSRSAKQQNSVGRQKKTRGVRVPWFQKTMHMTLSKNSLHGNQLQKNAVLAPIKKSPKKRKIRIVEEEDTFAYGVDYDNERQNWSASPKSSLLSKSDEDFALHEQHRLRAYAHLAKTKQLDIRAGPELIVKDRKQREALDSQLNQPEQELGLSMQFLYNF